MSGSSRSVLRWGILQLSVLLAMAGLWAPAAGSSGSQMQVAIVVLPPSGEQPASSEEDPTVSARLSADAAAPSAASLDLIVVDEHGTTDGWAVKIMQPSSEAAPVLLRQYADREEPRGLQPGRASVGASGDDLALGQPLTRMTPVIVAGPGSDAGTYHVGFELAAAEEVAPASPLIVSLSSAP